MHNVEDKQDTATPTVSFFELAQALNGIVQFKEPLTPENCAATLRGMALDFVKLERQVLVLRAALKEAL